MEDESGCDPKRSQTAPVPSRQIYGQDFEHRWPSSSVRIISCGCLCVTIALETGIHMHPSANPTLVTDETGLGSFLVTAVGWPALTNIACLRVV